MEAVKHLVNNVPDWLHRLDELNGQIEQRQKELAALAALAEKEKERSPDDLSSSRRSIRNKGSTESLKPRGEPEAHPGREATPQPAAAPEVTDGNTGGAAAAITTGAAAAEADTNQVPTSPSDSHSPSALAKQTNQVRAAGQARARATLRKRQRTDSVLSANGATPKYRTRSMIIVYYDSYVQTFFEDLVKFVSASRNMMRKAKMAAKVAQIKRLAELEMPDDDDDDDDDDDNKDGPPTASNGALEVSRNGKLGKSDTRALQYVSTRTMMGGGGTAAMLAASRAAMGRSSYSRAGARGLSTITLGPDGKPLGGDVYDELDKGLEYVQSMCEHAAHQFLRDGDCAEEVSNIQGRLRETKELADKEMGRIRKEKPEALEKEEEVRGRSYRPQSMRKDNIASLKAATSMESGLGATLEVDDAELVVDDTDPGPPPKLMYRSTRNMG